MKTMVMNKKGLTLVEIIVALAIIGLIAVIFWGSFSQGFITIISMGSKTKAMAEAQTLIDNINAKIPISEAEIIASIPSSVGDKKNSYDSLIAPYDNKNIRYWIFDKSIGGNSFKIVTILVFYQNGRSYITLASLFP